ncbi:hypothetical protein Tco_1349783, partial [Tanacetum coccineum]
MSAKQQRAMKDSLGAKHQRAVKDSLSAKPQQATSDNGRAFNVDVLHHRILDTSQLPSLRKQPLQNVVNEDLPQLLDLRGGSHVIDVLAFDVEDFSSWKD